MDIRKLQRAIVDGLEDVKAQNIVVFNTEHLSPLFERVIIASGTSNRQTKALASSVRETVKARGLPMLRTEGEDNGEWIIVDCGAAVAHIMQPSIRDYYRLEEIWGGKPVRLKLGSAGAGGLPKASEEPETVEAPARAVARKAAPKKAAGHATARKAGAKQPAPKAAPGARAPARQTTSAPVAAKPAAGRRAAPAKTVARKASSATAADARRAPRSKTPVKTVRVGAPATRRRSG